MPKALVFEKNGEWKDVLQLKELPSESLGHGQVRLRMLAAAVHPSDFGQIAGTYGKARALPAVAGREGVGEVVEVGCCTKGLKLGDRVRLPEDAGTWRAEVVTDAAGLTALPAELPAEQLSLSFINPPTAWRILHDFVGLQKGDSVVTNAGKSAVSEALIKIGARMGLKVYSVVRGKTDADAAILRGWGAAGVFDETEEYFKEIKAALALNQIGGESVLRLVKALREGGLCVTIGGAAKEPVRYPTRELIFNDVVLRGFWMDKWLRLHAGEETQKMMDEVWAMMASGALSQTVAGTYQLEAFATALAATASPGRLGKVLFVAE